MQNTIAIHEGLTDAAPEEVGYDSTHLRRLDDHYNALIGKETIQAAGYILSRKGKVFAHKTMGKLRPAVDSPDLMPDSLRKVYSITKAVTAIAIIQLIDRGRLYLDQAVCSIIPEFNNDKYRSITIMHLLTHTSGLRGDPGSYGEPYGLPWFEWAADELHKKGVDIGWVRVILSGPPQNAPGKEYIYSTSCYAILGEIVARVSGKSYEQYLQEEIFTPLGMTHSLFKVPTALRDNTCYTGPWEEKGIYEEPKEEEVQQAGPPKAGNGMYSTLADLQKLGQMMLNGGVGNGNRILSRRAVQLQTTNHLKGIVNHGWGTTQHNYKFGLGWSLEHNDLCSVGTFSHEGYGHSGLFIDPVEELVFAFLVPGPKGYTNESVITPRAIVWSGLL